MNDIDDLTNDVIDPRLDNEHWANVLVQALPYFRHWCGKIIVVKYGGNAMLNEELKAAVMEDIVLLSTIGVHVVLVHGGGPEINHMLERVGKESKFVNGLRYTDGETMEIVQMVLTGKLNKDIVGLLLQEGGKAVGLSGVDSGLLRAKRIQKDGADLGFVGEVTEVHPEIVQSLLAQGFIPVISTVALGEDGDMNRYNINADTAAAKIAIALGAEKFVQLTNVPGVLRDVNDPTSLIQRNDSENRVLHNGAKGRRSSHTHHRRTRSALAFNRDVQQPRYRHNDILTGTACFSISVKH